MHCNFFTLELFIFLVILVYFSWFLTMISDNIVQYFCVTDM